MKKRRIGEAAAAAAGLIVLIIDSKTAFAGAREGLDVCIRVLIPTLFPFFFLSSWLSGIISGISIPGGGIISRLYAIPSGTEALLLCGYLGGYPVGAVTVDEAVYRGQISPNMGKRLLSICNQCGPAFIFGMSAVLFNSPVAGWLLMLFQLLSAMITARLLPGSSDAVIGRNSIPSAKNPLDQAIRSTANVCGWVILFKILVVFIQRWILWLIPIAGQCAIVGLVEISNGCLLLHEIQSVEFRFLLCAAFLNFGGLCVTMQTFSMVKHTEKGFYLPGKLIQCAVAVTLCLILMGQPLLWIPLTFVVGFSMLLRKNEKRCRNFESIVV